MPPLRALLISDGRPGHYHLAEGILAAIERRRAVETVRLDVRRRFWTPGRWLAALLNRGVGEATILKLGYGVDPESLPKADLVVSAGGDTLAANAVAARLLKVPNIFYGSLRRFRPEDFALVLTSHARYASRPRHAMTLKPSALDPASFPRGGPAAHDGKGGVPATIGLLIGGNTSTIRYEAQDWDRLVDFMRTLHRDLGSCWLVSNSRRTQPEASDRLARLAAEPGCTVADFIDVRVPGARPLTDVFAGADAIVATVDSSSMVSEAVWAQRPVVVVAPENSRLPEHEQEYRNYLEANGWARSMEIKNLTPGGVAAALSEITPLTGNPLDRLADLLSEKLPALFARAQG